MHYIKIKKILEVRKYLKWGYIVIKYISCDEHMPGDIIFKNAFTYPEFYYIGGSRWAYRLCAVRGIKPQPIEPINIRTIEIDKIERTKELLKEDLLIKIPFQICQIGFCEKEQKWYGWSHRAIYGFGIGSVVKKGDCAYKPKDKADLLREMINFYIDENAELLETKFDVPNPHKEQPENLGLGCLIKYRVYLKSKKEWLVHTYWEEYPTKWGRGEWVAKTLEDAKQMAIDFARGVA